MPELPDLTMYIESLRTRIIGETLIRARVKSPSLLRTFDPPLSAAEGKVVRGVDRIGKQIVVELESQLFLVVHLMIAGRFHWKRTGAGGRGKSDLAAFDFPNGTLLLTEASTQKRASLHAVLGKSSLAVFNRGGLEVLTASPVEFREALERQNHTLKRTLTDPRLFSAIGNAYSDEILHAAGLSPLRRSQKLSPAEIDTLYQTTKKVLEKWILKLREEVGSGFPEKVTAFHPAMAVHGKFGKPCPVCGTAVQRIVYAANECNYCPRCQTGGRILADRSLSRLLKNEWPESIEEWEGAPGLGKLS
ncbi:MAG TPA: DNA-formamidopyrimidine glycosylase family protein [Bacteroidota bacterium]|nr:DNA-formamidopyrimidine glycosylase family protein [Bacteroidota bacterium]